MGHSWIRLNLLACSERQTHGRTARQRHAHAGAGSLPGSIGELEDDVIGQIIDFTQPEVISDVVAVHKRLEETNAVDFSWGVELIFILGHIKTKGTAVPECTDKTY